MAELAKALPTFIKDHKRYWLINTNLTVSAPQQQHNIKVINVLLQYARGKCNVLQIIKSTRNATKQKQETT